MNLKQSLLMTFTYVARVAKKPLKLEYDGHTYVLPNPKRVKLSAGFWRSMPCKMCGICCSQNNPDLPALVWLSDKNTYSLIGSTNITVNIDGKATELLVVTHGLGCPFQRDKLCSIHTFKPLLCQMPPLRFRYFTQLRLTMITKQHYPWRWHVGRLCPMQVETFTLPEFDSDIKKLERVAAISHVIGVRTHLDNLLKNIPRPVPLPGL